jgi:hypothetical protein
MAIADAITMIDNAITAKRIYGLNAIQELKQLYPGRVQQTELIGNTTATKKN